MRLAVISDIHGNASAFRQVLADIEACRVDHTLCLGDNIGYGPEPDTVTNMLRERNIPSVIGNHELAIKTPDFLGWFNPAAKLSLEISMGLISASNLDYLASLPDFITMFNYRFVHGFPPDSPTNYLFEMNPAMMETIMAEMAEPVCFVGHTHELAVVAYYEGSVDITPLGNQTFFLEPERKYIINAGSVGQPRDGSSEAKYLIFDNHDNSLEVRYVPYDINDTINKIHAAGLPKQHAYRLLWS